MYNSQVPLAVSMFLDDRPRSLLLDQPVWCSQYFNRIETEQQDTGKARDTRRQYDLLTEAEQTELLRILQAHPRYAEDFTPPDDVANLEPLAVRFTVDGRTFQDVRAKVDTASTTDRKIYIPALRFSTGSPIQLP